MNFRRDSTPDEPEINFIPLIDLLLVILIFLMVSTTFSRYSQLKIQLPSASKVETDKKLPNEIVIAVSKDGLYRLAKDKTALSAQALVLKLADLAKSYKKQKEPTVVIFADAAATHQAVIGVMEAARVAGLGRVTFPALGASAGK